MSIEHTISRIEQRKFIERELPKYIARVGEIKPVKQSVSEMLEAKWRLGVLRVTSNKPKGRKP